VQPLPFSRRVARVLSGGEWESIASRTQAPITAHTFEIALGTAQDSSIRLTAGWALVGTPMMSTSLPLPTGLGYSFSE
jgi:hypothetical protein